MRSYAQIVDTLYKQKEYSWLWPDFMQKICGWKEVPKWTNGTERTLAYRKYVDVRRLIVRSINEEIIRRGDCRLLRIKQAVRGKIGGVWWLSKTKSIPYMMVWRLRQATNGEAKTVEYCDNLLKASNVPEEHRTILKKQRMKAFRASQKKVDQFTTDMETKMLPPGLDDA